MNCESLFFVLAVLTAILCSSKIFGWKTVFAGTLIAIIAYTSVWTYCALLVVFFA